MPLPILLVIVGQQVFRIAATAAAKKAVTAVGGKIVQGGVKGLPKSFAKKTRYGEDAFTQLVKAKKPTFIDKIGNLFSKKSKKITQSTAGKIDKKSGIKLNKGRIAVRSLGDKVVGGGVVGTVLGAGALAKALSDKKKLQKQKKITTATSAKDKREANEKLGNQAKDLQQKLAKERAAKRKATTAAERAKRQVAIEKLVGQVVVADTKAKLLNEKLKNAPRPKLRPTK